MTPTDLPLMCDDPAADPLDCVALQLPAEVEGRQIGDGTPDVAQPAPEVAVVTEVGTVDPAPMLAATGVPVAPYVAVAVVLVALGAGMRRWSRA